MTDLRSGSLQPGVLHVIANLDTGGAQEVVRTLVPALAGEGFRPVVATLRDGPLRAPLELAGVPVEVIAGRRHSLAAPHRALPELIRLRRDLAGVVARHQIAIVQTHLLRSLDFLVLSLRREPGVRGVLWTIHNARLDLRDDQVPPGRVQQALLQPKRVAYRSLYRFGARAGDGFVAVSDEVSDSIRSEIRPPADRIATIANAADTERYPAIVDRATIRERLGVPDGQEFLLSVGKLMRQKGHADLIEAVRMVDDPGFVMLIAGEGELRADLESRIAASGVGERIRLLGIRRDVPELLAAADGFVLPSLWEGLPMALLEAMASRLPVLATEVSGTSQVVEHGVSGLLVPPSDPIRLADGFRALLGVMRDPSAGRAMGEAARARVVERYGVRAQAAAHAALYRSILERRAPAPAVARA
jgi:glycosyltransferase involved in cell wall biosynthesis